MNEKVSLEKATQEIEAWLNDKKIMPAQKEKYKDNIDILIEAIQYGCLEKCEDFSLKQILLHPVGTDGGITEIKYKNRLNDLMLRPYVKNVDADDADGRMTAFMAALSTQPKNVLMSMDGTDKRIAISIVVFFT